MTVTERADGSRSAFVRFGGLDWDMRAQLEALACDGEPAAEHGIAIDPRVNEVPS